MFNSHTAICSCNSHCNGETNKHRHRGPHSIRRGKCPNHHKPLQNSNAVVADAPLPHATLRESHDDSAPNCHVRNACHPRDRGDQKTATAAHNDTANKQNSTTAASYTLPLDTHKLQQYASTRRSGCRNLRKRPQHTCRWSTQGSRGIVSSQRVHVTATHSLALKRHTHTPFTQYMQYTQYSRNSGVDNTATRCLAHAATTPLTR